MKRLLVMFFIVCGCQHAFSQMVIEMVKDGGVYKVPCVVNGLRLKFIFDTGASQVCISESQAVMMLENDYLSVDDIKGTSQSQIADGRIVDNTKIILREIVIGNKKLKDVEAVVVHSQNAPLLLGQTAIEKLGKISLQGDKLVIEDFTNPTRLENRYLTEEECNQLFEEARNYYHNELYEDALEKYLLLYYNDFLSHIGVFKIAYCLLRTEKYEEAIKFFFQIEKSYIESESGNDTAELYKFISLCYLYMNQVRSYERYMLKAISCCDSPFLRFEYQALLGGRYIDFKEYHKAERYLKSVLNDYFQYMEIKSTDCWDKNYKNDFVAEIYYDISFCSEEYHEDLVNKYKIIAAKWGNKNSIEWCKKFNLDYSKKPSQYEY